MRMTVSSSVVPLVLVGVVLAGCGLRGSQVGGSSEGLPTTSVPSVSASATGVETTETTAQVACASIIDSIPLVSVKSGKPVVAGAFAVTGAQMTTYIVRTFNQLRGQSNGSDWWDQPSKTVDLCIYDGDFKTMSPGPEGHDTSATRVLVVISSGNAEFWASTLTQTAIPAVDPATMRD
jgi:hypothetical protein